MDYGLKGKTALVTGGTRGIGLATAKLLQAVGVNVIVTSRNKPTDLPVGMTWQYMDALEWVTLDAFRPYAPVDILINNVGGGGRWGETFDNSGISTWHQVMQKNLGAAVTMTRNCLPYMVEQRWGRVVTVASVYGKESGGKPWFNASKSAEISLMKSLSQERSYIRKNITFNTVCPGFIKAGANQADNEDLMAEVVSKCPMGRLGTPEEVASAIVFLCSQQASYINGACLTIDGGLSQSF